MAAQRKDHPSLVRPLIPLTPSAFEFQQVIGKADGAEGDRYEECDPNIKIAHIGKQDRRKNGGGEDQQPTHSRGAGFFLMGLRDFIADGLADMRGAKTLDENRSECERKSQRREPRHHGAKGFIAQDAETGVMGVEGIEEEVEHQRDLTPNPFP